MKLKEMLVRLRINCKVEIRDFENNHICSTGTDCKGVTPYADFEVVSWFVKTSEEIGFCVLIDDRGDENGEIK